MLGMPSGWDLPDNVLAYILLDLCFNYCFEKPQHRKFPLETNRFYVNSLLQRSMEENLTWEYFAVSKREAVLGGCVSLHSHV